MHDTIFVRMDVHKGQCHTNRFFWSLLTLRQYRI